MRNILTRPIKKASGGMLDWNDIGDRIAGNSYAVAPPLADTKGSINPIQAPIMASPSATFNPPPTTTTSPTSSFSSTMKGIAPFASNIVNAFRTPPQPPMPHLDNLVTLRSPSFNDERNQVERNTNADAEAAARGVDGNTGARIRLFALGQKLDRLSSVNERDKNMQLQTQNEQSRINAGLNAGNNRKLDEYDQQQVERRIAQQQQQSANLSNFSDKYIGIQNENEKRRVDLEKTKTMSTLFGRSGVGDRERKTLRDMGVDDPLGMNYSDVKRAGGFFRGLPLRAQTLKSLYKAPN
jgi:hypothetical protein